MPQSTYLSTDPHAGDPIPAGYLSMDPHAGDTVAPPATSSGAPFGIPEPIYEVGKGAAAGLLSTIAHGGDLIRRATGMQRVIDTPEVQKAITPPDSIPGKVGYYGEQGAEFAVPLGEIAGATKALPMAARMGAEALASGVVAGVQSGGDKGQMLAAGAMGALAPPVGALARATVSTARRAAAGAAEGGIGGAIAATLRSASPLPAKAMVMQALKPRAVRVSFDQTLERALPELKLTEQEIGKPIASLDDLLEAAKAAKQRIRAQYDQMAGPKRAIGSTVDLSDVGDEMLKSIPKKTLLEDPAKAKTIAETAALYRQRFPLEQAEQLLKETNAELDGFYAKYPAGQRRALESSPEVAPLVAQAKALRTAIYNTLDDPGQGAAARELQRRYGSVMEVEEEAYRRLNVARRQQPESLAEQIAGAGAMGDLAKGVWRLSHGNLAGVADIISARAQRAAAKYLKEQQTTDMLIKRAFNVYDGRPTPVVMPPQRPPIGELPPGPLVTPPPQDPSFARGVPADYGVREVQGEIVPEPPGPVAARRGDRLPAPPAGPGPRALLPSASNPPFVPRGPSGGPSIPLPGEAPRVPTAADAKVKTVPAAVADLQLGGEKVYSSDPNARSVKAVPLDDAEKVEIRSILAEMEAMPFTKRSFNEAPVGHGGSLEVVPGGAGAPVYQDIVSLHGREAGRDAIIEGLQKTLDGKPSTYGPAIREAARMRLKGTLPRQLPPDAGVRAPQFSGAMNDADYEQFANFVDDQAAVARREAPPAPNPVEEVSPTPTRTPSLTPSYKTLPPPKPKARAFVAEPGDNLSDFEVRVTNHVLARVTDTPRSSKQISDALTRYEWHGRTATERGDAATRTNESLRRLIDRGHVVRYYTPEGDPRYVRAGVPKPAGLVTDAEMDALERQAATPKIDVDPHTGEQQARLPGAEAARQVGRADTTFKAPQQASGNDFNLTPAGPEPEAPPAPDLFSEPAAAAAPKPADLPPGVSHNDIPRDVAERAYSGTSHNPEQRAANDQRGYVEHMTKVWQGLVDRAKTPEQQDIARAEFDRYRQNYAAKYRAYLESRSGLVSSFIAGPSNFPAARMNKKSDVVHRKLNEFLEWDTRARGAMERAVTPVEAKAVSADRSDAVDILQKKIENATKLQDAMKAGNALIRRKDLTDEQKIAELVKLGLREDTARKALEKDFAGRIGFPDYALKNNNAEIRRLQGRVSEITQTRATPAGSATFEGGRVEENADANRIQVFFDAKPDEATRAKLKAAGFKWAPSQGAWQRQRTDNARAMTEKLLGVNLTTAEPSAAVPTPPATPAASVASPDKWAADAWRDKSPRQMITDFVHTTWGEFGMGDLVTAVLRSTAKGSKTGGDQKEKIADWIKRALADLEKHERGQG